MAEMLFSLLIIGVLWLLAAGLVEGVAAFITHRRERRRRSVDGSFADSDCSSEAGIW